MTSVKDFERLAHLFHNAYEQNAVEAGWETQERSRRPWEDIPEENRQTMLATCRDIIAAGWRSPEHCQELTDKAEKAETELSYLKARHRQLAHEHEQRLASLRKAIEVWAHENELAEPPLNWSRLNGILDNLPGSD